MNATRMRRKYGSSWRDGRGWTSLADLRRLHADHSNTLWQCRRRRPAHRLHAARSSSSPDEPAAHEDAALRPGLEGKHFDEHGAFINSGPASRRPFAAEYARVGSTPAVLRLEYPEGTTFVGNSVTRSAGRARSLLSMVFDRRAHQFPRPHRMQFEPRRATVRTDPLTGPLVTPPRSPSMNGSRPPREATRGVPRRARRRGVL